MVFRVARNPQDEACSAPHAGLQQRQAGERPGAEPDIVCIGKGVASGIPLGAMIARKSVATWPLASHGNTFGGNPIACAA
ncbi:MAG: aminotransferase class III-fold pyridoxal phosphate-dependent enzyme, partial [Rhizomicrobium sp.]